MKKLSLFLSFLLVVFLGGCSGTSDSVTPDKTAPVKKDVIEVKKEYYTGGMLRSEFHMYDKTGMNGLKKAYGYEGHMTSKVEIRNGVKQGDETWYDTKGRIIQVVPYENGRIEGVKTAYYPNGTPMVTVTYVKGMKHGPAAKYKQDGTVFEKAVFRNDRQIR